jgi:hypothetical protein
MGKTCEFHFQEGFTGNTVELAVDGKSSARFEARTRVQIGLARIETLALEAGQTVSIALPALGLKRDFLVSAADRWVTVNVADNTLVVQSVQAGPGYV